MPTSKMPAVDRAGLTTLAVASAAATAVLLLYRDVLVRLFAAWDQDPNYSHGFVIAPLCAYIVWRRRQELTTTCGSWFGLAGMAGSFALLTAGELGAELFLTRVSLIAMLASIALLVVGWRGLRLIALPVALLLMTIPIPAIIFNQIAFPLQLLASRVGETALQALSIPVLREGNVITLAAMQLEVAEACSGIRSLMSLLSLAIVYGYFTHDSAWRRGALIAASIPIAICANAARVAGTGVAAHYYGSAAAEGFLHTFSGWLIFVVAFGLLLACDSVMLRRLARAALVGHTPSEVTA